MFTTAYSKNAKWNESFWQNESFNKLLNEARSEQSETKRREMYVEMQRIVRDDGGSVIPLFNNYVWAAKSKVQHGKLHSYNNLDGYKLAERWWFA